MTKHPPHTRNQGRSRVLCDNLTSHEPQARQVGLSKDSTSVSIKDLFNFPFQVSELDIHEFVLKK